MMLHVLLLFLLVVECLQDIDCGSNADDCIFVMTSIAWVSKWMYCYWQGFAQVISNSLSKYNM